MPHNLLTRRETMSTIMFRTKNKRSLLYCFLLAGGLMSGLLPHQSAFGDSKCGVTLGYSHTVSHLFSGTFNYISTSNSEKMIAESKNTTPPMEYKCPPGVSLYAVINSKNGPMENGKLPLGLGLGMGIKLFLSGKPLHLPRVELGNSLSTNTVTMQTFISGKLPETSGISVLGNAGNISIYGSDDPNNPLMVIYVSTFGRVTFRDYQCRPEVNITQVALRDAQISEFKSVNSRIAPKPFSIKIGNCARLPGTIIYRIDPMTAIVGPGAAAPSADSTARGIGVQLLNENNTPIEFGTNYPTTGAPASPTKSIDLRAAYFQMDNNPSAGSVGASFMLTLMVN